MTMPPPVSDSAPMHNPNPFQSSDMLKSDEQQSSPKAAQLKAKHSAKNEARRQRKIGQLEAKINAKDDKISELADMVTIIEHQQQMIANQKLVIHAMSKKKEEKITELATTLTTIEGNKKIIENQKREIAELERKRQAQEEAAIRAMSQKSCCIIL